MDRQEDEENNECLDDYCILCREGSENEELITPCGCRGHEGKQYYHYSCLIQHIQHNNDNPCTQCGKHYTDPRIRRRATHWYQWFLSIDFISSMGWVFGFIVIMYSIGEMLYSRFNTDTSYDKLAIFVYTFSCVFALISSGFIATFLAYGYYSEWWHRYRSGFIDFTIDGPNGNKIMITYDVTFVQNLNEEIDELYNEELMFEREWENYNTDWDQFIEDIRNTYGINSDDDESSEYATADEDELSDSFYDALDDDNDVHKTINELLRRIDQIESDKAVIVELVDNLTERVVNNADQETVQQTIDDLLNTLDDRDRELTAVNQLLAQYRQ